LFKDSLINNLKDGNQVEILRETTSTIENLAIATRSGFAPIAGDIIKILMDQIRNGNFPFNNKHFIIRALSGIAKGLGFEMMSRSGCLNPLFELINGITNATISANLDLSDKSCFDFFNDLVSSLLMFYSRVFIGSDQSIMNNIKPPVELIQNAYKLISNCPKSLEADDIYVSLGEFFSVTSHLGYIKQNNDVMRFLIGNNVEILRSAYTNIREEERGVTIKNLLSEFQLI